MIIPSIDILDGQAVQLQGGKEVKLLAGDPLQFLEQFKYTGEIAVIDLNAALGRGSNQALIRKMLEQAPCRVGGGIRSVTAAQQWLDWGAQKVILGTMACAEVLSQLPAERVMAALDAENGEIVSHGWTRRTGISIEEKLRQLEPYVSGFLITFVEREGRLQGTALDRARDLAALVNTRITFAGGIVSAEEIAQLDQLGADAQVGMALYTGQISLAQAFCAPLVSDRPDGLWPTVVVDEHNQALGLCYSNQESVAAALNRGRGVYWSRTRGLWEKGHSSGCVQTLIRIDADCDRDCLRFTVTQAGPGFCHSGSYSCWGDVFNLNELARKLEKKLQSADPDSYTQRLVRSPSLLEAKLQEEALELATAQSPAQVAWEAADLIYFALVAMARAKVTLGQVQAELQRRSLKLFRRKGDAKVPQHQVSSPGAPAASPG